MKVFSKEKFIEVEGEERYKFSKRWVDEIDGKEVLNGCCGLHCGLYGIEKKWCVEQGKIQYTWNFDEDSEYWGRGMFDTVQECIDEAKDSNYSCQEKHENVFIAECVLYKPSVCIEYIFESMQEQAWDEHGECAEEWNPLGNSSNEERDKLTNDINNLIYEFMDKYGEEPNFYTINNIKEYELED